jgi:ribosomal protein L17
MSKEELIQFLKENLKVKVNNIHPLYDERDGGYLRVELYLGNERIDWDEDYID